MSKQLFIAFIFLSYFFNSCNLNTYELSTDVEKKCLLLTPIDDPYLKHIYITETDLSDGSCVEYDIKKNNLIENNIIEFNKDISNKYTVIITSRFGKNKNDSKYQNFLKNDSISHSIELKANKKYHVSTHDTHAIYETNFETDSIGNICNLSNN